MYHDNDKNENLQAFIKNTQLLTQKRVQPYSEDDYIEPPSLWKSIKKIFTKKSQQKIPNQFNNWDIEDINNLDDWDNLSPVGINFYTMILKN